MVTEIGRKRPLGVLSGGPARPARVEPLERRALLSATFGFQAVGFLDTPAAGPGNLTHVNDFEAGSINNRGEIAYGTDLSSGGEGVFIRTPAGTEIAVARAGDTAPDGAQYTDIFLGEVTLNNAGDLPFGFQRKPEFETADGVLLGVNAGLYFYSHRTGAVTALVLPGQAAPGGGDFRGVGFRSTITDGGTIAFTGIIPSNMGPGANIRQKPTDTQGLGQGIFLTNARGRVTKVIRPGDPAPGGKTFDWVQNPWINNAGDIAFGGHITGEPFIQFNQVSTPGTSLFTAESQYLRHRNGRIESIAHIGSPAPGGGTFKFAFGGNLNDAGDLVYFGALPADVPGTGHLPLDSNTGIFLHTRDGRDLAVARPGDAMPGGGHLATAGFFTPDLDINNGGTIVFSAELDTSTGGVPDTGVYEWAGGRLRLVARSGTVMPGIGTIKAMQPPPAVGAPFPLSSAKSNDAGQVLFGATLTDGRGVMLVASPEGGAGGDDGGHGGRHGDDRGHGDDDRSNGDRNERDDVLHRVSPGRFRF